MADEKKPTAPSTPTKAHGEAVGADEPITPRVTFTPDPLIPTTSEWAEQTGPPTNMKGPWGYQSKRIDIWPRVPFDPTDYLNLNAPGMGEFLAGLPGMIADKGPNDKISRVPETDIPFGALVAVGDTGDGYCKKATAASQKILGIAMRDTTSEGSLVPLYGATAGTSTEIYPKDRWSVAIVRVGRVWAIPSTVVKEGDAVGVSTGGAPTSVTTGGIPGMHWATSAPANMLAVLQLNLP